MSTASHLPHSRTSPLLLSTKLLIRDSIFRRLDVQNEFACPEKAKESMIYQHLQRRIEHAQQDHTALMDALQQKITATALMVEKEKSILHEKKIGLWELRNQVMHLQEAIEQEEAQLQQQYGEGEQYDEEEEQQEDQEQEEYQEEPAEIESGEINDQEQCSEGEEEGQEQQVTDLHQLLSRWGVGVPSLQLQ